MAVLRVVLLAIDIKLGFQLGKYVNKGFSRGR